MSMTIQSSVKDKILATSSETSKVENAPAEMLRDLDQQMEKRADDAQSEAFKQENALAERLHGLDQQMERKEDENATESVRDTIGFEYCFASSSGWTKSLVLWVEIGESSLTGPELVLDTTDKVVLIKEKLKVARDRQKNYADKRRKPLEFEILERIGPVAYRLRLPEELSSVHGTFHVSNLKKCLADANLHVPLNEIKINKTLRFVEELVEIMDREIRNLKLIKSQDEISLRRGYCDNRDLSRGNVPTKLLIFIGSGDTFRSHVRVGCICMLACMIVKYLSCHVCINHSEYRDDKKDVRNRG
ncbi:hypothetical protein Tco_0333453 [Tanacetum coccineum]